jgi:hypothetical protein
LLTGNNTVTFTGQTYLGDAALIDNVFVYSQNIVQVVQSYKRYLALTGGIGKYFYSSICPKQVASGAPFLNSTGTWCANTKKPGQFFQISAPEIVIWKSIMTQDKYRDPNYNTDCSKCCSFVKNYTVQYTIDGFNWYSYASAKIFQANTGNQQIQKNLINLTALSIRIYPLEWQ